MINKENGGTREYRNFEHTPPCHDYISRFPQPEVHLMDYTRVYPKVSELSR